VPVHGAVVLTVIMHPQSVAQYPPSQVAFATTISVVKHELVLTQLKLQYLLYPGGKLTPPQLFEELQFGVEHGFV
jgi:hypothetical protein